MSDADELAALKKQIAELKQRIDPEPRPRSNHAPVDTPKERVSPERYARFNQRSAGSLNEPASR